jgi:4-hydroxybenzoate polyprenyltransferase
MKSLLPYAQLVRLPNVFSAVADIVLGFLVTGALWSGEPAEALRWSRLGPFVCLLIASTLLYWGGMVFNDYFDLNEDRRDRPGRPLPSGRVAVSTALWLGMGCLAGGVLFALLADLQADALRFVSTSIAICLVMAILLYDGALKETWLGPLVMGGCRMLNILLGLSVVGSFPPGWGLLLAAVIGIYIAGVTLFARTEATMSNASDLTTAAAVIAASLLMALAVPALAQARAGDATFSTSLLFPYLLVVFGFYLAAAIVPAIRSPAPNRVQSAVKRALLGLVLFDALLACSLVGTLGLLLALLILPGIYLGRWLYST